MMVKLSDYLDYLNAEVVQARKKADKYAVKMAKEYATDNYLKHFRTPRFTMPSVKLDIPVKISKVDSKVKYKLNLDKEAYLHIVNTKIQEVNQLKRLNIQPMTLNQLATDEFNTIIKEFKNYDNRYVEKIDHIINKIDFKTIVKSPVIKGQFTAADKKNESEVLSQIMRESLEPFYTPVSVRLDNIFIDPTPKSFADEGKMIVKMNVDMIEEGIKINYVEDKDGNKFEEIIID